MRLQLSSAPGSSLLYLSFSPNIFPPLSPCRYLLSLWWPLYEADLDRNGSVRQKHPARNNISHQIKKQNKTKKKKGKSVRSAIKCRTWLRRRRKGFQWGLGCTKDFNAASFLTTNVILLFDPCFSALGNTSCRSCKAVLRSPNNQVASSHTMHNLIILAFWHKKTSRDSSGSGWVLPWFSHRNKDCQFICWMLPMTVCLLCTCHPASSPSVMSVHTASQRWAVQSQYFWHRHKTSQTHFSPTICGRNNAFSPPTPWPVQKRRALFED